MVLTEAQLKILKAIIDYISDKGYAPTVRELSNLTGYRSASTVHYHVKILELYGYITAEDGKSRTAKLNIQLIKQRGYGKLLD